MWLANTCRLLNNLRQYSGEKVGLDCTYYHLLDMFVVRAVYSVIHSLVIVVWQMY